MRLLHEAGNNQSSLMNKAGCLGQPYYTVQASNDARVTLQSSGVFDGASVLYYASLSKRGPWNLIATHTAADLDVVVLQQAYIKAITNGEGGTKSEGFVLFGDPPTADDTLTVNGLELTYVDADPGLYEILIGTIDESVTNTANKLNSLKTMGESALYNLLFAANLDDDKVEITYAISGEEGNAITLAVDSGDISVSDDTLTGGIAPTTSINADVSP